MMVVRRVGVHVSGGLRKQLRQYGSAVRVVTIAATAAAAIGADGVVDVVLQNV
jgi:hypothetical protein